MVGKKVFFRGLVEFSNVCSKDCLYCGIRKSNEKVIRYNASDDEILGACRDFKLSFELLNFSITRGLTSTLRFNTNHLN